MQLFENGRIMSWVNLKGEYELTNDMFFQWAQLNHAIPTRWKTLISNYSDIDEKNFSQIIMLLKELEFCLPTNYPLWKHFNFNFRHRSQTSILKNCLKTQL